MKKTVSLIVILVSLMSLLTGCLDDNEGSSKSGAIPAIAVDNNLSVASTRAIIDAYVPRKGKGTIFVNASNYNGYEGAMAKYISVLKSKGYDYDDMILAFRMAEAVGESVRTLSDEENPYDPNKTKSFITGFLNDQENAIYLRGNDTEGYEVALAFQGTSSSYSGDWGSNLDIGTGNIHEGYQKRAQEIFDAGIEINGLSLRGLIATAENGQVTFFLTGHSMGGAIAQDFAILLLEAGVPANQITGYTFNCALSITEAHPYYSEDLNFFNTANQSDNVSSGDVVGLHERGRRIGYDMPLYDPYQSGNGGFDIPNDYHGLDYLMGIIEYNKALLGGKYDTPVASTPESAPESSPEPETNKWDDFDLLGDWKQTYGSEGGAAPWSMYNGRTVSFSSSGQCNLWSPLDSFIVSDFYGSQFNLNITGLLGGNPIYTVEITDSNNIEVYLGSKLEFKFTRIE